MGLNADPGRLFFFYQFSIFIRNHTVCRQKLVFISLHLKYLFILKMVSEDFRRLHLFWVLSHPETSFRER